MLKLRQTVIVEGKYDLMRLRNVLDCNILTTNGFRIFSDPEKRALIRRLALRDGIILLTDSDRAGFRIRGYISGFVPARYIRQVYIPEIFGKEPRKAAPSKEGKLGVEGIDEQTLLACFQKAGITAEGVEAPAPREPLTAADLYELGLSGGQESAIKRRQLAHSLELPASLSTSALLRVLNLLYSREEFLRLMQKSAQ